MNFVISIKFSKNLSKSNRQYETKLIKEINDTCNKTTLNENDKEKLVELHSKLDEIYTKRAKGAYIRSRAKWIEEGEIFFF